MAHITVYQAGAWFEFYECMHDLLKAQAAVVIIPERENRRNVAQAFAARLNPDAILTIPELIARYLQSRDRKGLISPHVVESILGSIMAESFVPYLKMEKLKQSYIRTLADFIGNFRQTALVGLEEAIAGFKTDSLSFKEKDLVKIYGEYERRLPDYGYDLRSALEEFLLHAGGDNIHRHLGLRENEGVIFWGFDYLCPLEEEFIFTLFKYLPRAVFFSCADTCAPEQATRIGKSIAALLERAKTLRLELRTLYPQQEDFFMDFSRNLFRPGPQVAAEAAAGAEPAKPAEPQSTVAVTRSNSRFQEIVAIARQIRRLNEAGAAPRKIRVVAPAYDLYSLIIEEVFPEYGIPFFLELGVPLLRFPLAAVILHLVNQGAGSNPYPLREKILSSPYVGFCDEVSPASLAAYQQASGAELLDPEKLKARIKPDQYRLDYNYVRNTRQEAYRTVKPIPGIPLLEVVRRCLEMAGWKNAAEKEEQFGRCLVQFYLQDQAEKALAAWPARMSGDEFQKTLLAMLDRFHIAENSGFSPDGFPALKLREREQAVLRRIDKVLAEMTSFLAAAQQAPAEKHTLAELARIFSRLMGEASLDGEEYCGGGGAAGAVAIQPVERGQYKKWEYTFICGMVDGEFPAAEAFNFLQPKKEGLGLGQSHTSVDHGRNRFYQLVRSTAGALYLSRPLSDNGRRLPPSPLLKEIEKRLPAELRDNEKPPGGEGVPWSENKEADLGREMLYSRREKLIYIGKNVDHHYDRVQPLLHELKNSDQAFFSNIVEILRFDGLTLNTAGFSEYDGLFGQAPSPSPPAVSALAQLAEEIRNITFTPAVLERYAACPLRFFFDDILRLRQGPDFNPDTTETGLLVRSILKEYTARACAVRGVPPDTPLLFLQAVERYLQELEEKGADAFSARFFNGLAAGLDKHSAQRRGLLSAFYEHETNGPDYLSPYWANLVGAVNPGDGPEIQVEADRVDLAGTTGCLLAFLYTGAGAGNPDGIRRGMRFDLPLAVLLCMNYAAEHSPELQVAGAGLYQVKTAKTVRRNGYFALEEIRALRQANASPELPVFSGQREGFLPREKFALALEKCREHILRLYRLMRKGVFHLPLCFELEQSCGNCSFSRLCRKDQLRLENFRAVIAGDASAGENLNIIKEIF